jgi:ABC-type polysaccharide/polyol phosphate transport system ATPase subunit
VTGTPRVRLQAVSKAYRIYAHPRHRLLEALWRGRRTYHRELWALRDVSVEVPSGVTLGIIGMNGSGKSTLLQVIAGIVQPTRGRVSVEGRIASLLELGAGFNPEFTGRENVLMHGAIMGLPRDEVLGRVPAIQAFAEIGDFFDQPVKTYSSGMFVRLAFAAAVHVDPDVLLVDEALAVGDAVFRHRCLRKIREFQAAGKTICVVSHDTGLVKAVCSRALLLHQGVVQADADPETVVNLYHARIADLEGGRAGPGVGAPAAGPAAPAALAATAYRADPGFDARIGLFRHGTGGARIRNVELLRADTGPAGASVGFDEEVVLRVHLQFYEEAPLAVLGFVLRDKNGVDVMGTNTAEEGIRLPPRGPGQTLVVDFRQRLPLMPGSYSVTSALAYSRSDPVYYDWVDNAHVFDVLPPRDRHVYGKVWLPVEITVRE